MMTKQRSNSNEDEQSDAPKLKNRVMKVHDCTWEKISIEATRRRINLVDLIDDMWASYDRLPVRERGWALHRSNEANVDSPPGVAAVLLDIYANPRPGEEILSELLRKHVARR
jgi:hypothetical protein